MPHTFTAIDFETAQAKHWSICSVGLVRIENGEIVKTLNILVKPPYNEYWSRNIEVHGIRAKDTVNSPTFDKVWNEIAPYIINQTVVAHNGFKFDFSALRQALGYYGIGEPSYNKCCTYKIYNQRLNLLCNKFDIPLNYHDALSDAKACATLYLMHLRRV